MHWVLLNYSPQIASSPKVYNLVSSLKLQLFRFLLIAVHEGLPLWRKFIDQLDAAILLSYTQSQKNGQGKSNRSFV